MASWPGVVAPETPLSGFAASILDPAFSLPFFLTLNTSLGKSATAIVKAPTSPTIAIKTAEMGSQGCSSVLYSIERYLHTVSGTRNQSTPRRLAYSFRSEYFSHPFLTRVVAASALSRTWDLLTRQTATRLGASEHRILSVFKNW